MNVVILCGGQGTRIQEATGGLRPKPMVEIGGRPILWHIMKLFAHQGHTSFVLCLGHLKSVIKDYFLHYESFNSDVTVKLGTGGEVTFHRAHEESGWSVTLSDTGESAMTGARVARVRPYLDGDRFMMTYGDGVADIDLGRLIAFHKAHGRVATVTGVEPIGRFGRLVVRENRVVAFEEKPAGEFGGRINGGFFVFEPGVFDYLETKSSCVLEQEPLQNLAADGQLMMYPHDGFWQCLDTPRDLQLLQNLWEGGTAPWAMWRGAEARDVR